jgi:hypothetical protein
MRAAYRGDVEIVKSLLAFGAHVDQETIKLAKNRRNKEIVSVLENHLKSQQETAKTDKPVESFVKESEQEVEILLDLGEQLKPLRGMGEVFSNTADFLENFDIPFLSQFL